MKRRMLGFIPVLFILFFTSNCSGIKPFSQVVSVSALTPPLSEHMTYVKSYSNNYNYLPSSAEENRNLNQNKGQYKFSVSLPATAMIEF